MTEEIIQNNLEPILNRTPMIISGWKGSRMRRLADAYPDFQPVIRTHQL